MFRSRADSSPRGSDTHSHTSCSLKDLLFETKYAAQIFDWQNAVFLLFMPLLLALATFTFRYVCVSRSLLLLFKVYFTPQLGLFLLFMPLLALATFIFRYAANNKALSLCTRSLFDACAYLRALFGSSGNVKLDDVFKNAGDMQKMYRDWTIRGSQGAEMTTVVRMSKFSNSVPFVYQNSVRRKSKFSALSIDTMEA